MTDAAAELTPNIVEFDEPGLADASVSGDTGAFELLYAHYFPRVRSFCLRKLGDRELAEDIAQEAFARAFERIGTFGGPRHFGGWVSTIAANLCTDHLRRRKHAPISLERVEHGPSYEVDPVHDLQREDSGRLVRHALEKLEPHHREALMLHEVGGASCAAVGARLGISEVAAESLLARARRRLRKEITAKAAPADLFGVGGVGLLPAFLRAWRRTRQSFSRRLTNAQASAARTWESVAAPVTSAVDGGKALVVALGAGVAITVAGAAAPPVQHSEPAATTPKAPIASVAPAPPAGAEAPSTTAEAGTLPGVPGGTSVSGGASVQGPQVPGAEGSPRGDLGVGLDTDLSDPTNSGGLARVVLQDVDGKDLLDTGELRVGAPN